MLSYKKICECCKQKFDQMGIVFDFEDNEHLQYPENLDDIYKNMVYHSQNRSQNCAFNFFKNEEAISNSIWNVIANYEFNFADDFDYINLFKLLRENEYLRGTFRLNKGKDIQFMGLAKTCQCIKKYLNNYTDLNDFVEHHKFGPSTDTFAILKNVADSIYNMGTELIPDFFKEQDCIVGREFLIKADLHVKRFFEVLCDSENMSDKKVLDKIFELYNNEPDEEFKKSFAPYKLDKYIYLIGKTLHNPQDSKNFARSVKAEADI